MTVAIAPHLAIANVGNKAPTWAQILPVGLVDLGVIALALYVFHRAVVQPRRAARSAGTKRHRRDTGAPGRGATEDDGRRE